jgi:hypothetical protein
VPIVLQTVTQSGRVSEQDTRLRRSVPVPDLAEVARDRSGPGELGSPIAEVGAQCWCVPRIHRQVFVSEPVEAGKHADEDLQVEPGVVCGGPVEETVAAVPACQDIDVGEVPGLCPPEQGSVFLAARSRELRVGPRSVVSTGSSAGLSRPTSMMRKRSLGHVIQVRENTGSPVARQYAERHITVLG